MLCAHVSLLSTEIPALQLPGTAVGSLSRDAGGRTCPQCSSCLSLYPFPILLELELGTLEFWRFRHNPRALGHQDRFLHCWRFIPTPAPLFSWPSPRSGSPR